MNNFITIALASLVIVGCSKKENQLFDKLSPDESKVAFVNQLDESKNISILDYLYYYNGGGVALGDINNDGLVDIYFTSNQGKNKLYLNKGANKFEDISLKAGVEGESDWNTGSIMADVNGDGYLDIYVCAVVGIHGFEGHNELYINNKDNTFTESAAEYGLDLDNFSTSAAFLDYDNDGDLDMYLLNHAVHSEASYGKADIRNKRSYETGDKLFRNDNGHFVDVSEKAGIFGGANGYGLGIAVSDFNLDGNPDIYICNDFHEDDYYYLNNGDGTFTESMKNYFGHTSRFSMGVDAADINHDGFPDLMTLDMLPEDETALKSSAGDDNPQMLKYRTEKLGYHYQYTRNMLQINQAGKHFTETALLSGVAATDWSWSTLFADYDQDGEQDIFVCNGIPKRPNDLDYIKYYSNSNIKTKLNSTKLIDKQALKKMPSANVPNYVFQGSKDLQFKNRSNDWIENDSIISNGGAYADLDPTAIVADSPLLWPAVISAYGVLRPGISQIRLNRPVETPPDSNSPPIIGTIVINPDDDRLVIFTPDEDTAPQNTLNPIDAIIDPLISGPGDGLPSPVTGVRYLLTESTGNYDNVANPAAWAGTAGQPLVASANDIIEWDGNKWSVVMDAGATNDQIIYLTNIYTNVQYKWNGVQWGKSFEGEYARGTWRLEL